MLLPKDPSTAQYILEQHYIINAIFVGTTTALSQFGYQHNCSLNIRFTSWDLFFTHICMSLTGRFAPVGRNVNHYIVTKGNVRSSHF